MAQKFEGTKDLEAMRAVAKALKNRSLEEFEGILKEYTSGELYSPLIHLPCRMALLT